MSADRGDSPLRVVAVIDSLGQGGAERSLASCLIALRREINAAVVIERRTEEGFEHEVRAAGLPIHHIEGRLPVRIWRFRRLVRALEPDVVHTSLWRSDLLARLSLLGTPTALLCSLVNMPYEHSRSTGYSLRRRIWLRALQSVDRLTARRVDRFHAITQAVKDHYVTVLGLEERSIDVVWRGRDAEYFVPPSPTVRLRSRQHVRATGPIVVSIGRQDPQKNHRMLVEAMETVARVLPGTRCLIVGREGASTTALKSMVEDRGLHDVVELVGFDSDVRTHLHAADCFVLCSDYEGLGGAVVEAMLCGVPVIATDLPPIREISNDGQAVELVERGRSEHLADAILAILTDPSRARELGTEGRRWAEQRFVSSNTDPAMLDLYLTTVGVH